MFNNLSNQQQLVPMGMQQQSIANMPVQNMQTYNSHLPSISYGYDTFLNVENQQQTGKGFWDGFKTVFSKIGEFCTDNFGVILAGLGIFGGYKFCSSSMKAYEENKKDNKLDKNGNLKEKDATIKENVMNFVGHGVHKIFGTSDYIENTDEENDKVNEEKSNNYDIDEELSKDNISTLLKNTKSDSNKIEVLEKIAKRIKDGNLSPSSHFDRRQSTIISTLKNLVGCGDGNIEVRAKIIATNLKNNNYFNKTQQKELAKIAETKNVDKKD